MDLNSQLVSNGSSFSYNDRMDIRLIKRGLLETDKRLVWKLAWNMGVKGARAIWEGPNEAREVLRHACGCKATFSVAGCSTK